MAQLPEVRSSVQLPPLSATNGLTNHICSASMMRRLNLRKTYRLLALRQTTPLKLCLKLLQQERYCSAPSHIFSLNQLNFSSVSRYEEALNLAQVYNLNTDLVYQKQWAAAPVSPESVKVLHLGLLVLHSVYSSYSSASTRRITSTVFTISAGCCGSATDAYPMSHKPSNSSWNTVLSCTRGLNRYPSNRTTIGHRTTTHGADVDV